MNIMIVKLQYVKIFYAIHKVFGTSLIEHCYLTSFDNKMCIELFLLFIRKPWNTNQGRGYGTYAWRAHAGEMNLRMDID